MAEDDSPAENPIPSGEKSDAQSEGICDVHGPGKNSEAEDRKVAQAAVKTGVRILTMR